MSDSPIIRERITTTVEVAISLPCDWKTFGLWLYRAEAVFEERSGRKASYDDDLMFTSDGEQLVASFDITKTKRAS